MYVVSRTHDHNILGRIQSADLLAYSSPSLHHNRVKYKAHSITLYFLTFTPTCDILGLDTYFSPLDLDPQRCSETFNPHKVEEATLESIVPVQVIEFFSLHQCFDRDE